MHKGIEKNFSDETYSFQFWGADNGTDGTLILIVHSESQDADDYFSVASETKLETGRWYHLLATWDSGRLAIYIDGKRTMKPWRRWAEPKTAPGLSLSERIWTRTTAIPDGTTWASTAS